MRCCRKLLETRLVAALAELGPVRDEVARNGMKGLCDRGSRRAVLTQDDERERGVGQRERHQDADDHPPTCHPLSPEHLSHYSSHPPKGTTRSRGFYPHALRPLGSTSSSADAAHASAWRPESREHARRRASGDANTRPTTIP